MVSYLILLIPLFPFCSGGICGDVTHADVPGPYYESRGLAIHNIAPPHQLNKSNQIVVRGQITNMECRPIPGNTVEVWYAGPLPKKGCSCVEHVSSSGYGNCIKFSDELGGKICYVHEPSTCSDKVESHNDKGFFKSAEACRTERAGYTFPPEKLWYRGVMFTDKNGWYEYKATFPEMYKERPIRHIHYKITDNTSGTELVTQLYFHDFVPPSYEDYVQGRDTQFPNEIIKKEVGNEIFFNVIMNVPLTRVP